MKYLYTLLLLTFSIVSHAQLYKMVDNLNVSGLPQNNKFEFSVRMTARETSIYCYVFSSERFTKIGSSAYLQDENGKRYNFRSSTNNSNGNTINFDPLPKDCNSFKLVSYPYTFSFDLNNAEGRKVTHAGRRELTPVLRDICDDLKDLVSQYYGNIGLGNDAHGIFYMKHIADIDFSINGSVLTFCCKLDRDQFDSYVDFWFDISDFNVVDEIDYGKYQGEREKGPQHFIHLSSPNGFFRREISNHGLSTTNYVGTFNDYYFWTSIPNVANKFHNGLLWIKAASQNPDISYTNLNSAPPSMKRKVIDETRPTNNHSSQGGANRTNIFKPGNATVVDNTGSHNFTSYDCPNMTVVDLNSSVKITWGGDTVVLSPDNSTKSSYTASSNTSRGRVTIKAYRSSRTGKIYLVTVNMPNPSYGVSDITINFKP